MKFTDCLSSVVFFVYCSSAVLVIVNRQPTTRTLTEMRSHHLEPSWPKRSLELANWKTSIIKAAGVDKTDTEQDASKSEQFQ